MSYSSRQSNGIAPNGRAVKSGYSDSSQGNFPLLVYLILSEVSQQQKTHYQGSSDGGPFVQSIGGVSKSSPHNPNVRSQYSNLYHASPNTSPQSPNHHPQRRQTQHPRPQVRLPSAPSSIPNHKTQQSPQVNRDSNVKSRQPPQPTQVKSAPVSSSRRHRHSNSNSSKASTGSTGWSSTVNESSHSSLSSTPSWESKPQPPHPNPQNSDLPPQDSSATDSE